MAIHARDGQSQDLSSLVDYIGMRIGRSLGTVPQHEYGSTCA